MSAQLKSDLQSYLENLNLFKNVLDEEKQNIEIQNLEAYPTLMSKKEGIINQLKQRYEALQQYATEQPLDVFFEKQTDPELTNIIKNVKAATMTCAHQNQVNGMLIIASKNLTDKMLDLMTGRNQNRVYSKQAKAVSEIESTKSQRI